MAQNVAHVPRRHKHKKVDRLSRAERRARLLERQATWVQQWVALATAVIEALLQGEVQGLLGRPMGQWGDRTAEVAVEAACTKCQRQWRSWFRRNGRYRRSLVLEGLVIEFRVPRLRCACGGTVDLSFSVFAPYQRLSPELEARLREAVALGLSLRQVGAVTAAANGGPLAKSTINARVEGVERLVSAFRAEELARVPPVALLDGVWVKVLERTGETFTDAQGRERPRVRRKSVGLLVAYGVDPTTGAWEVLDWEQAEQEDQASWERLLERLRKRGLTAARGLRLIVSDGSEGLAAALGLVDLGPGVAHQRCVFHKLRNIGKAVKAVQATTREEKRAQRRQVVQAAAAVYDGADGAAIEARREAFVAKWQETEPEAVATLLRDFAATVVYLEVQAAAAARGERWDTRYLRTTSALERLNRTLREMVRHVVIFHSTGGLESRVYLTLLRAGVLLFERGRDWQEVVEDALAA